MKPQNHFKQLALMLLASTSILVSCTPSASPQAPPITESKGSYQTISAEEAKRMMDSGEPYVLIDVRTQAEFDEKHIEGALLIPNETIGTDPIELLPDKNATLLIYCRSGNRSQQAAEKLAAMGYTQVFDFGGIIDWPY